MQEGWEVRLVGGQKSCRRGPVHPTHPAHRHPLLRHHDVDAVAAGLARLVADLGTPAGDAAVLGTVGLHAWWDGWVAWWERRFQENPQTSEHVPPGAAHRPCRLQQRGSEMRTVPVTRRRHRRRRRRQSSSGRWTTATRRPLWRPPACRWPGGRAGRRAPAVTAAGAAAGRPPGGTRGAGGAAPSCCSVGEAPRCGEEVGRRLAVWGAAAGGALAIGDCDGHVQCHTVNLRWLWARNVDGMQAIEQHMPHGGRCRKTATQRDCAQVPGRHLPTAPLPPPSAGSNDSPLRVDILRCVSHPY
jgi:hypothetical protein